MCGGWVMGATNCPACDAAAMAPATCGAYRSKCSECTARHLAHGPEHFESQQAGRITSAYRYALVAAFGETWASGHKRVRHWAMLIAESKAKLL